MDKNKTPDLKKEIEIKDMAIRLHNSYEMLSKNYHWKTQSVCNEKAFDDLPKENKMVMFAMASSILDLIERSKASAEKETAEKVQKLKDKLQYIIPTEDELYFDEAFKEIFGDEK